jgi:hypothetical protein
MNPQEMERRFLGHFIHTLAMDEQVRWLKEQPEIGQALDAMAKEEHWMTIPFADALETIYRVQTDQITQTGERERIANAFTVGAVLNEATLPQGIVVTVSPGDVPLDMRIDRQVTLEFVAGMSVVARYNLDPKVGKGKLCAGYKKFVREHLASRLANCNPVT